MVNWQLSSTQLQHAAQNLVRPSHAGLCQDCLSQHSDPEKKTTESKIRIYFVQDPTMIHLSQLHLYLLNFWKYYLPIKKKCPKIFGISHLLYFPIFMVQH